MTDDKKKGLGQDTAAEHDVPEQGTKAAGPAPEKTSQNIDTDQAATPEAAEQGSAAHGVEASADADLKHAFEQDMAAQGTDDEVPADDLPAIDLSDIDVPDIGLPGAELPEPESPAALNDDPADDFTGAHQGDAQPIETADAETTDTTADLPDAELDDVLPPPAETVAAPARDNAPEKAAEPPAKNFADLEVEEDDTSISLDDLTIGDSPDPLPGAKGAPVSPAATPSLDGSSILQELDDSLLQDGLSPRVETPGAFRPTMAGGFLDDGPDIVLESDAEDDSRDTRPAHERLYSRVLQVLRSSDDLMVDSLAVARINELIRAGRLPQLAVRDLMAERLIDRTQLARAVARAQSRVEINSVQDLPDGARELRRELDTRAQVLLREQRVIPIRRRMNEQNQNELHLAHENAMRNLVLESALGEILPGYIFVWHYANRDVCGQFWLSDDEGIGVDEGMEAEALLERMITTAVDAKASDIHIDPNMKGEGKATIKYRIDGLVRPKEVISIEQLERLRVRIENVARMPKVDHSHPNKGAFSRAGYDWRVQIQPHAGRAGPVPRVVIRRLNPDSMPLEKLGYTPYMIKKVTTAAKASNGVIFWTGPTGSGKTESIHSAVISVDPMGRGLSVQTIEDPPEKRVDGYAVQMEMAEGDDSRSGLALLKSSLRADPDVIIFGEVRDAEMAKLVFEAANTGHLVFSTLHTNTSIDAIVRLDELDIRGFLVSYIRGIAAQRLVRRLCTHCRQPMHQPDEWTKFVFDFYKIGMEGATLFKANPEGCPNCNFTGYRGRIAIAEWLVPSREIVEATAHREFEKLEELAVKAGWRPMGYMGVEHVKNGITDADELGRVVLELTVQLRDDEVAAKKKKNK